MTEQRPHPGTRGESTSQIAFTIRAEPPPTTHASATRLLGVYR